MIIDVLVLVVLLISAIIAFLRGAIREILTIAGVVGGFAGAVAIGPSLAPIMRGWFGVEEGVKPGRLFDMIPYTYVADALAYGLVFITIVIVLSVLSHFLAESAKNLGLGPVDRTLGFIFGLLRGAALLGLLYLPVHLYVEDEAKDSWFENSRTHVYLEKSSAVLAEFLPEDAVQNAQGKLEKLGEANDARKTLEESGLLESDKEELGEDGLRPATDDPAIEGQNDGYSEEFRNKMNRLFEDENSDPQE